MIRKILAALLISTQAFAGLPPTSIQGQYDTSAKTKFNFQFPYQSFSDLGGIKAYVDTGNRNLLVNSSFDHTTYSTGWTITTASGAVETSTIHDGKQSAKITYSASTGDIAQSVTPSVQLSGTNVEASCWVNTTLSTIQVCGLYNGVEQQCVNAPSSGNWSYVPVVFGYATNGTSIGVRVKTSSSTTGSFYADDCYVGPSRINGSGYVGTDWASYTPTFSGSGFGTVTNAAVYYRRIGDTLYVHGAAQSGTTTAAPGGITFPNSASADSTKFSSSTNLTHAVGWIQASGAGGSANPWSGGETATLCIDTGTLTQVQTCQSSTTTYGGYNVSAFLGSSKWFFFEFSIPIQGWTSTQSAYRADATPASWSGYQSGFTGSSSVCDISSATMGDLSACTGITLNQTSNRNFGTVTTAGSSLPGITLTFPRSGYFEVCAYPRFVISASPVVSAKLTDGTSSSFPVDFSPSGGGNIPTICWKYLASASSTTIKLQAACSTGDCYLKAGTYAYALAWDITELDAPMPAPYITGSVTSTTTGQEHLERLFFAGSSNSSSCTGTCTVYSQSGSWTAGGTTGVTRTGTGAYTITATAGEFSSTPVCTVAGDWGVSSNKFCSQNFSGSSSTSILIQCQTAGSAADAGAEVICMGPH